MNIYTSSEILGKADLYDLQDTFCSSGIPFKYQMTSGEIAYFKYVKGSYCIADYIESNMDGSGILTFNDCSELSKALKDDGLNYRAVMLDDNTALQKLFFWLSIEE